MKRHRAAISSSDPMYGTLLTAVLEFLPLVNSLPLVSPVCREWNRCMSSDKIWYAECCRLWAVDNTADVKELMRVTRKRMQYFGSLVPWKGQYRLMRAVILPRRSCVWVDLHDGTPIHPDPYLYMDAFRQHDLDSQRPDTTTDADGIERKDYMHELHAELQSDNYEPWVRNASVVTDLALRIAAGHSFCLHVVESAPNYSEPDENVPDPELLARALKWHKLQSHGAHVPCPFRASALWNLGVGQPVRMELADPAPRWVEVLDRSMMHMAQHGDGIDRSTFTYSRNAYESLRVIERTCLQHDCTKVAKPQPRYWEEYYKTSGDIYLRGKSCFLPWVCGEDQFGPHRFPTDTELELKVPKSEYWAEHSRSPQMCARWMPPGAIRYKISESCVKCAQVYAGSGAAVCLDCFTRHEKQTLRVRLCDSCMATRPPDWPEMHSRPTKRLRAQCVHTNL